MFGEGWSEYAVVIDGSVTADGNGVRVRGVTITGDLAAKGNNFGISFSRVLGTTSITGQAGAYLRNFFCGPTVVPSSNATLLDNHGVPDRDPTAGRVRPRRRSDRRVILAGPHFSDGSPERLRAPLRALLGYSPRGSRAPR